MNRTVVFASLVLLVFACASTMAHALTAPRDGGPRSEGAVGVIEKDPTAYRNQRAWVEKARDAKRARELAARSGVAAFSTPLSNGMAIEGTMNVPVLLGYFSNQTTPGTPISQAQLQNQFFDGNPTGTVSQYYTEVSYGQFTIDGAVAPWRQVSQLNSFYAGPSGEQGLVPGSSHTGDFIKELLDANDATIDFGLYDSDGPDGLPNSGDDDGFVDVLCVMHSFRGGECPIAANIASHAWIYSAWPVSGGLPYTTNDARSGGGFIQVDDYNITPALSCNATNQANEVGTLCHELGHGLGLPDLYDRNLLTGIPDGNRGIGDWGIMGTGNWNTPDKPAHLDPWCKKELGWLVPTLVGWQSTVANIPNVEDNATAFMLPFTDERFRRSTSCAINGAYSFYCGLPVSEGDARNWESPGPIGGYGSNWYQTLARDFTYSGTGSVAYQFVCTYDLETGFDFAYALVEVNGVETTLIAHTGAGGGTANVNLTTALAPLAGAGGTYTLKFRVVTDYSFDDADGLDPSACGAFVFDDVSVTGGGETYADDFELHGGGWYQDPAENPVSEYWLVENRRRIGFDQGLHDQGLLIWHVDEEVLDAVYQVNDAPGGAVRGLVLDEADGLFNLNDGINSNTGQPQDVFPGPLDNTSFNSGTSPNSEDNTGRTTQISVTFIGPSSPTMSATLRAGDPAPVASSVIPNVIDNDQVAAVVDVAGSQLRYGATFRLVKAPGSQTTQGTRDSDDVIPTSLEWVDATLLRGTLNVYSKTSGLWDLVVTSPDGQTVTLADAVMLNLIVATKLLSAAIDVVDDGVRLRYELLGREDGEVLRLYRSTRADGGWVAIVDDLLAVHGESYEYVDANVVPGKTYFYLLESELPGGEVRELHRGSAVVPARELVLEQNHPNPFNPRTSIRFYLPERGPIELDVYDVRGALVRRLAIGNFDSGPHAVDWDGTNADGEPVASGMYVYRLVTDRRAIAKKMILLK